MLLILWHIIGFVFGCGWYKLLTQNTSKFEESNIKDGGIIIWPVTISFPMAVEILTKFSGVTGVMYVSDIAGELAYNAYILASGVSLIFWIYAILFTVGILIDAVFTKNTKASLNSFFGSEKPANFEERSKRDSKMAKEQGLFFFAVILGIYFAEGFRWYAVGIATLLWVIMLATRWNTDD